MYICTLPVYGMSTQFILRREAVCLYRDFLRVSREVGGSREREDMKRWVRGEFDKWKGITDEVCRIALGLEPVSSLLT